MQSVASSDGFDREFHEARRRYMQIHDTDLLGEIEMVSQTAAATNLEREHFCEIDEKNICCEMRLGNLI